MTAILECRSLRKSYGGLTAVDDVSFTLADGEVVGLVGPNGAGKTTLVDLITGVQAADAGDVLLHGKRLRGAPAARARRGGLARTFQHPQLASELTLREHLVLGRTAATIGGPVRLAASFFLGLRRRSARMAESEVEEVADALGLGDLDRPVGDLTLGEMRMGEVARALTQDPNVLLLDEPFAGSDSHGATRMSTMVREVASQRCSVLLIDHNVDIVAALVDRIVLLAQGAVIFDGDPAECMASEVTRAVYFGSAH